MRSNKPHIKLKINYKTPHSMHAASNNVHAFASKMNPHLKDLWKVFCVLLL